MPLINCPDCEKEISDRAASCLHCGCPISGVDASSSIAKIIKEISKTEQTSRTCPKCQATQGFRTIGSILGNDATLINTNSVTSGSVFDAVNGKLMEEYQEATITSGTQNSVLVTNSQEAFQYWYSRNPDTIKKAEFLDAFTCGVCLAVIDKTGHASSVGAVAEQIFIGKSLYGSWRNYFLPIDLPDDALDLVVRHTIFACKPFSTYAEWTGSRQFPCRVIESDDVREDGGPVFHWFYGRTKEQLNEMPIIGRLTQFSEKTVTERGKKKSDAISEKNLLRKRVVVRVNHKGERGLRMECDIRKKTNFGLLSTFSEDLDIDTRYKEGFLNTFSRDLMKALDLYAIKRSDGIPEDQIKQLFNVTSN